MLTDPRTDGRTDTPSYRDATAHLKILFTPSTMYHCTIIVYFSCLYFFRLKLSTAVCFLLLLYFFLFFPLLFCRRYGLLGHAQNLARIQKNEVSFVIHNLPIIAKMAAISKACGNMFGLLQVGVVQQQQATLTELLLFLLFLLLLLLLLFTILSTSLRETLLLFALIFFFLPLRSKRSAIKFLRIPFSVG